MLLVMLLRRLLLLLRCKLLFHLIDETLGSRLDALLQSLLHQLGSLQWILLGRLRRRRWRRRQRWIKRLSFDQGTRLNGRVVLLFLLLMLLLLRRDRHLLLLYYLRMSHLFLREQKVITGAEVGRAQHN